MAHFGGGIATVKERLVGKGYRFGTLKKPFGDYFDRSIWIWLGLKAASRRSTARFKVRPEQLIFASDYPQDFTGVNADTGKGMLDLKKIG